MAVGPSQRHTRTHRCPVCDGADQDPRGAGKRCMGFTSDDREWCHCSREEYAGAMEAHDTTGLYVHKLFGACHCGVEHEPSLRVVEGFGGEIEATYDYRDENGNLLYQVVRYRGKRFKQRRPDPEGGWLWKLGGVRRVLYRLPELLASDASGTVYVVEGEKDAHALAVHGLIATCNAGGAGKWTSVDRYAEALRGRTVVVIADADAPGRAHAEQVRRSLDGFAKNVRIVELTQKDVSDFFEAGGTLEEFLSQASLPRGPCFTLIEADTIFAPLPPRNWLIPNLMIGPGAPTGLFAYSWGGKSIIAQDLVLCVACGLPVFGQFRCRQGRVVHIDHEQGTYETSDRYQRLARARGLDFGRMGGQVAFASLPPIYLNSPGAEDAYKYAADGAELVYVDSLSAGQPGEDENAVAFALGLAMLGRVSEATGASILTVGHTGKMDLSVDKPQDGRTLPRGHSQILGACSSAFALSGGKGQPKLVKQIKGRSFGAPELDDFYLAIEQVQIAGYLNPEISGDPGGIRIAYRTIEQVELAAGHDVNSARFALEKRIIEYVCSNPRVSGKRIYRDVPGGRKPIIETLQILEEEGRLQNLGSKGKQQWMAVMQEPL